MTLRHPDAKQIAVAMRELTKVIPDYREPSSIRLAMSPLATSFAEVWDAVEILARILDMREWDQPQFLARKAVT